MNRIICIAGPTASGKTALAVAMAQALDGEVVSCDSMQVYRQMDIGTAKPTREEMQGIPHHMLDVCDPRENFSVSRYCEMATPILEDILARGKTAIVAGGTGLYMDALIRGNAFAPYPATGRREALEREADALGMEAMLAKLAKIDPDSAARLHLKDRKRILRALEVYEETGKTITQHNLETQAQPPRFRALWLGLDFDDRARLYRRIDLRVDRMVQAGLEGEIRALLASGVPPTATSMQAIGYKEFTAALLGDASWDEAVEKVKQASRNYAKRQRTWFRRNNRMHWLRWDAGEDFSQIFAVACNNAQEFDWGSVV